MSRRLSSLSIRFAVPIGIACLLLAAPLAACSVPGPAWPVAEGSVAETGTLSVVVRHGWPKRVQAVLADVERLAVTVRAYQQTYVQFIDQSAFGAGRTTLNFTDLRANQVSVTLQALAADGRTLGEVSQQASVVPGQAVQLTMTLQLEPTYPAGPSTGGITTDLEPMEAPTAGTLAASFPVTVAAGSPKGLAVDAQNHVWVLRNGELTKFATDGSTLATIATTGSRFALDSAGNVWVASWDTLTKFSPTGAPLATATPGGAGLALDASDHVWISRGQELRRLTPDAAVAGTYAMGAETSDLAVDRASGVVWAVMKQPGGTTYTLARVSAQGALLGLTPFETPFPDVKPQLGAAGEAWLLARGLTNADRHSVCRISADGLSVQRHEVGVWPVGVSLDAAGHIWTASASTNANNVTRLSPAGTRVGVNTVPGSAYAVACAPNGDVWVLTNTHLTRLTP